MLMLIEMMRSHSSSDYVAAKTISYEYSAAAVYNIVVKWLAIHWVVGGGI